MTSAKSADSTPKNSGKGGMTSPAHASVTGKKSVGSKMSMKRPVGSPRR